MNNPCYTLQRSKVSLGIGSISVYNFVQPCSEYKYITNRLIWTTSLSRHIRGYATYQIEWFCVSEYSGETLEWGGKKTMKSWTSKNKTSPCDMVFI